ncbi:uncharacterized protein LOC115884781 [Sitophilus oryzae]|uniref:Uncharacterized protein LOC115884781 n=1 Tax=Sitophilus oryzae TaxID=7048 RepID=A0A6J2Y7Y2_SITOR|nr:uncharacterized protein LOC115884781 [Sitophilus oryzae]
MIDLMWYLGLPMFAVGVCGVPYKRESENGTRYDWNQYDTVYDRKQTGTENLKVNVDGVSLIWTTNSLLAAAALLEPALYGEFPDSNVDLIFGSDGEKPEDIDLFGEKPSSTTKKPVEKPNKTTSPTSTTETVPEVVIVEHNTPKVESSQKKSSPGIRRRIQWPQLLKSVLRSRSPEPEADE